MKSDRMAVVALIASVTVVISGCGGSESGDGDGTATELTLLASNLVQPGFERMIEDFEEAHPDIEIKATYVPSEQRAQLLLTQLSSGNASDLFVTTPGSVGPTSIGELQDKLLDLSGSSWLEPIPDQERVPITAGGKVLGYPAFLTAGVIVYNEDMFDENGWEVPTTADELLELCPKIEQAGKTPVVVPGGDSLAATPLLSSNHSHVFVRSPDWLELRDREEVKFSTSPEWRASLQALVDMKGGGCFSPDAAATTLPDGFKQMAEESAAMFATTAAQVGSILAVNSSVNLALFPFPGPTASDRQVATASGLTISINAETDHPDEAKTFLEFLGSPDQAALFAELTGGLSYARAASGDLPESWSLLGPLFDEGKFAPFWTVRPPNPNFFPYTNTAMQGLLTGQLSVDQVLTEFDRLWDDPKATP